MNQTGFKKVHLTNTYIYAELIRELVSFETAYGKIVGESGDFLCCDNRGFQWIESREAMLNTNNYKFYGAVWVNQVAMCTPRGDYLIQDETERVIFRGSIRDILVVYPTGAGYALRHGHDIVPINCQPSVIRDLEVVIIDPPHIEDHPTVFSA